MLSVIRFETHQMVTLRSLGQRWLKIVWKVWQPSAMYDADLHGRNQLKHGSWALQLILKADALAQT